MGPVLALALSLLALAPPPTLAEPVYGASGELLRAEGLRVPSRPGLERPRVGDAPGVFGPFAACGVDSGYSVDGPRLWTDAHGDIRLGFRHRGPVQPKLVAGVATTTNARDWSAPSLLEETRGRVIDPPAVQLTDGIEALLWGGIDDEFEEHMSFLDVRGESQVYRLRTHEDICTAYVPELVRHEKTLTAAWWELIRVGERTCGDWRRVVTAVSRDDGATWDPLQEIVPILWSDTSGGPTLVVGPDGTRLLATIVPGDRFSIVRRGPDESTWTPTAVPAIGTLTQPQIPSLAVAPDGTICLAFTADVNPGAPPARVFASITEDLGESWSDPEEISLGIDADMNQYESHVAWGNGAWHLAWLSNVPWTNYLDVWYASWEGPDGPDPTPVRVNEVLGEVEPQVPYSVDVAVDGLGYAYIAWAQLRPGFYDSDSILVATTRPETLPTPPPAAGLRAHPQPFRDTVTLRAGGLTGGAATIHVFDAAGRRLRRWSDHPLVEGTLELDWDGTDADGRAVPAGVYFWAVEPTEGAGDTARTRIVRLR